MDKSLQDLVENYAKIARKNVTQAARKIRPGASRKFWCNSGVIFNQIMQIFVHPQYWEKPWHIKASWPVCDVEGRPKWLHHHGLEKQLHHHRLRMMNLAAPALCFFVFWRVFRVFFLCDVLLMFFSCVFFGVAMPYFCALRAQKYGIFYPGQLLYDGDAPKCKHFWHTVICFFG